jgi:hypothetical protein
MARFDQALHSRARQIRRRRRKETVEPIAAGFGRNPIGKGKIIFLTHACLFGPSPPGTTIKVPTP